MNKPALVWFRLDLRLADNPALAAAAALQKRIVPVFIWAPDEEGDWPPGAASRWWLHQSLKSLDRDFRHRGMRLIYRLGPTLNALRALVRETGASDVFWNRRYEPDVIARDEQVRQALGADGVHVETFNASLLFDPGATKNSSGKPFQVFTPFWRACGSAAPDFFTLPMPTLKRFRTSLSSLALEALNLEPAINWSKGFHSAWQPGEAGAQKILAKFLSARIDHYPEKRDYPASDGTSRLSPHLHFGEISPRQVWAACAERRSAATKAFLRQLGWREFAHHLLFHFPHTIEKPLRAQFEMFPWRRDPEKLHSWQRGTTGFPIIDAGMRELCATGWMHNRARMITGSFLVKDLLLSWTEGARWYWDTLVDADLANNTLGWQWVAGCGADAAPYFRIFNPSVQAKKFDADEGYVNRWVPERSTPDYPKPIVNHARAREKALQALAIVRKG